MYANTSTVKSGSSIYILIYAEMRQVALWPSTEALKALVPSMSKIVLVGMANPRAFPTN